MTNADVETAIAAFVQTLRDLAPYDTGNLALNAIRYEKTGPGQYKIYVDLNIAPYQVYLNENPKNKHHDWWQAACRRIHRRQRPTQHPAP